MVSVLTGIFCVPVQDELVFDIVKSGGILLTAFSTVVIHQDILHKYDWHYVILDEGHKIRNPDAQVTLACKMVTIILYRQSTVLHFLFKPE